MRHLTLACKPETKALFEHQGFADQVICKEDWQSRMADEFDGWCPLMSLPLRFGTRLDSIPASLPISRRTPSLLPGGSHALAHQDFASASSGVEIRGTRMTRRAHCRALPHSLPCGPCPTSALSVCKG